MALTYPQPVTPHVIGFVLLNPLQRYLINEQSKPVLEPDGSLKLYFSAEKPAGVPDGNRLPAPKQQTYRLTFGFYGPIDGVSNGTYWPPGLAKRTDSDIHA